MLYDKRWEKPEVKADPFSLDSFIAWLERQPADTAYDWNDTNDCMVCRYLDDVGAKPIHPGTKYLPRIHALDKVFSSMEEYHAIGAAWPWTYGAALSRARKAACA